MHVLKIDAFLGSLGSWSHWLKHSNSNMRSAALEGSHFFLSTVFYCTCVGEWIIRERHIHRVNTNYLSFYPTVLIPAATSKFPWKIFIDKLLLLVCTQKKWQIFLDKEPGFKASHDIFQQRSRVYNRPGKIDKEMRSTPLCTYENILFTTFFKKFIHLFELLEVSNCVDRFSRQETCHGKLLVCTGLYRQGPAYVNNVIEKLSVVNIAECKISLWLDSTTTEFREIESLHNLYRT